MTEGEHTRAQQLMAQASVEGISGSDQAWLDAHLRECASCSAEAARTQALIRSFRNVSVLVPRDLAARTQMRIRLRAQESAESSTSSMFLWVITAASWLLGVFSAPLVWRMFAWVGMRLDLPKPLLEVGFVLWWTVPALIAVAVVLYQRDATRGARSL